MGGDTGQANAKGSKAGNGWTPGYSPGRGAIAAPNINPPSVNPGRGGKRTSDAGGHGKVHMAPVLMGRRLQCHMHVTKFL